MILKFYKSPGLKCGQLAKKINSVSRVADVVADLESEICYYIEAETAFDKNEVEIIKWILTSPFERDELKDKSLFENEDSKKTVLIEIGPRLNFSTPFSSNAVSICKSVHLDKVKRIEVSTRYLVRLKSVVDNTTENEIVNALHDRMTECRYLSPIETFDHGFRPEEWFEVDVMTKGRKALEDVNSKLGLAFDNWDLDFYTDLFRSKLKRNPTSVECFDLAQSNSEHSRHWFFKGRMIIDGEEKKESLIDMIIETQSTSNQNNVIKFSDNSSAIEGFEVTGLRPNETHAPSNFKLEKMKQHLIFTAETHNFPTGVAPFR
ncbi:phosphoribosylformylglycinamidine synthase-like [Belonocnema kinseyi]|uniref:phosphoribosylformylglycinamidine synthase-like n=1 Tax=Belonocnema kinseyi TaxID=2817044 RepID=UPI00143D27A1|nr:phosphoribosylformylglycinamidine synthase-like [Belonocnema kinseyi]